MPVERDQPLMEAGLDSIGSVELRNLVWVPKHGLLLMIVLSVPCLQFACCPARPHSCRVGGRLTRRIKHRRAMPCR